MKSRVLALATVIAISTVLFLGLRQRWHQTTKLSREEKYGVAEQVIEEEGFRHSAAQEARETGKEQGVSPKETAGMGAVAKQMGR